MLSAEIPERSLHSPRLNDTLGTTLTQQSPFANQLYLQQAYSHQKQLTSGNNANSSSLRGSFISPECAYSLENRMYFDKIGLNKRAKSKNQMAITSNSSQGVSGVTPSSTSEDVDKMFLRRRCKVNDAYYEMRASSISEIRKKKGYQVIQKSAQANLLKKVLENRQSNDKSFNLSQGRFQMSQSKYGCLNLSTNKNYEGCDLKTVMITDEDQAYGEMSQIALRLNTQDHNNIQNDYQAGIRQGHYDYYQNQQQPTCSRSFMALRKMRDSSSHYAHRRQSAPKMASSLSQARRTAGFNRSSLRQSDAFEHNSTMIATRSTLPNELNMTADQFDSRSIISGNSSSIRGQGALSRVSIKNMSKLNLMQYVPQIKGISKQHLLELYNAKCDDLQINTCKQQMIRFFELIKNSIHKHERKLILDDMGLGDNAASIVGKIIRNNKQFSTLDLNKNQITNKGIKQIAHYLKENKTIVHLRIGCNQITSEGFIDLFKALHNQSSIVSIDLANQDCYKNKNKLGTKGATALCELLEINPFIQFLNLADNNISSDALGYICQGLISNPNIVSVNLMQNEIGATPNQFQHILGLFQGSELNPDLIACQSLEELNLAQNSLNNRNMEELAKTLKNCGKTKLTRLDLSNNKISAKGFLSLVQTLRNNFQLKLSHLNLDKSQFEMGSTNDQISNFFQLITILTEYLRSNKSTLKYLSLNQCNIGKELLSAIGKGLQVNDRLEVLNLNKNNIEESGIYDICEAFKINQNLQLKVLELGSNRINDQGGINLAQSMKNAENLEQISLRDNNLGVEAGEALKFLVQQKQNLWRVQIEMNMIKYVTQLEIEKLCKRNKRMAKFIRHVPKYKDVINEYSQKIDPSLKIHDMDHQISVQKQLIKQGIRLVFDEEEYVHDIINQGKEQMQSYNSEKQNLQKQLKSLDDQLHLLDKQIKSRERELQRKVHEEEHLLQRYRECVDQTEAQLRIEKEKLRHKKVRRVISDEEIKLRQELEKVTRENEMMLIIMENYEKEIKRRQNQIDSPSRNKEKSSVSFIGLNLKVNSTMEQDTIDIKNEKQFEIIKEDSDKKIKRKKSMKRGSSKKVKQNEGVKYVTALVKQQSSAKK